MRTFPVEHYASREDQFLAIARRLFAERGFARTSLSDIADEAKVTKAALYYYFPNKDGLYERVVVHAMESLLETVRAEVAQAASPADKVRVFMLASAGYIDEKRDEWVAAARTFWDAGESKHHGVAMSIRESYEKLLRRCIAEGVESGEFRAIDPAVAGRLLLAALNHLPRWHKPKGPLSARQAMEQIVDLTLLGIVSEAHRNRSARGTDAKATVGRRASRTR